MYAYQFAHEHDLDLKIVQREKTDEPHRWNLLLRLDNNVTGASFFIRDMSPGPSVVINNDNLWELVWDYYSTYGSYLHRAYEDALADDLEFTTFVLNHPHYWPGKTVEELLFSEEADLDWYIQARKFHDFLGSDEAWDEFLNWVEAEGDDDDEQEGWDD